MNVMLYSDAYEFFNRYIKPKNKCEWVIRGGYNNTFWAYTSCKSGYNYLSKVSKVESIKPEYDDKICPICGKPIECNIDYFKVVE